jgi:uncharacterized phiE125 gp8 family phage protein
VSSLTVVTGPTLEPVSLLEFKAHSRRDDIDTDDGYLVGCLIEARQHIEKRTGRALMLQTFKMRIDYDWPRDTWRCRRRICLPKPPLYASSPITSITYVDTNGATQTLASNQYIVSQGDIEGVIEEAYGVTWPSVRCQMDAIEITFLAGYGTNPGDVPGPIRRAISLLASHFYENREATMVGTTVVELPLGVEALISQYIAEGWI